MGRGATEVEASPSREALRLAGPRARGTVKLKLGKTREAPWGVRSDLPPQPVGAKKTGTAGPEAGSQNRKNFVTSTPMGQRSGRARPRLERVSIGRTSI